MDEKTRELLEGLATKLGTKVEFLGEELVHYIYIQGWVQTVCGTVAALAGVIVLRTMWKVRKEFNDDKIGHMLGGMAGVLIAPLFVVIGFVEASHGVIKILAPVGAAIKSFL